MACDSSGKSTSHACGIILHRLVRQLLGNYAVLGCHAAEKGEALNSIAVSAVTLFLLLSGSIVARSQPLATDHMSYASSPAEAFSLVHESGSSWGQWLSHHTCPSMQKSDIGAPQSAGAPSTGLEAEVFESNNTQSHATKSALTERDR